MLIDGMEVCPLGKSDLRALDFVVDRFFMKLLPTGNIEVVRLAQRMFGFVLPIAFSLINVVINFCMVKYIISQCCQLFNLIVFFLFSFIVLCLYFVCCIATNFGE